MDHSGHDMGAMSADKSAPTAAPAMNHGDHSGHGSMTMGGNASGQSGGGHHGMQMWFHFGEDETVLFAFWKISEIGGLLGSMVAIFVLAFLYEGLKFYREHLYRHSFQTVQVNTASVPVENGSTVKETQKTVQVKMMSWMHIWQTCLHVLQVILSYFLMLIFMTYNVWLCLAVVVGAGAGYFFFGWKKSLVVDITEHCH